VVVKVDDVSGSGLILPGDRVDVLVHLADHAGDMAKNSRTSTRTFLHNVKVFAVNNVYSRESNGETVITAKTISLLVTPQQAELVTMASEMGRIRLVMRSADDETESDSTGVTPHQLMGDADEGPSEPLPPLHALRNPPLVTPAPAAAPAGPTGPDMKNSWKMLMIEGDTVSEVEFEDGTRMGSPTQIRQIHQGTRGAGSAAAAMPLAPSAPLPPALPLPELPPVKIDTDPPPSETPAEPPSP
jgi:pilus assembly protein CpaB